ncbi:hypothetical protein [Nonomuraea maritima]|uniref:hypothetical protein n=1 Tax=Nonomuraea maritima TaxID=683260 RepID=UPI003717048B
MNDQFSSTVRANHGTIHSGSGDVINVFAQLAESAGKDPRAIADDQLAWLRKRFVPPGGFARAKAILQSSSTVFLEGQLGTGRTTAAWMLLEDFYSGTETIHELLLRDKKATYLDADQITEHALLLVDLSALTDERIWIDVQGELSGLRKVIHQRKAHLVVVLPTERNGTLRADLGAYSVTLSRPAEQKVLRSYLRAESIPTAATDAMPADCVEFFAKAPPIRRIADFASLVIEARDAMGSDGDFAVWCKKALAVLDNKQSASVRDKLATLCWGPQRAMLLATAMLHGAHVENVHRACASLLQVVGHPQAQHPLLEQADTAVLLKEIGATTDSFGKVRFNDFGFDSAVRNHFWTHWPNLRESIRTWVVEVIGISGIDQEDRDKLIKRFAEQCLHHRYRDLLPEFVQHCAENPRNGPRMNAAFLALRQGLEHEEHARIFRQTIYTWSTNATISKGLLQVLVVACWKVIAVHHPGQAMVRLHHLARREHGTTYARDVLAEMVDSDVQLRVWILRRLVDRLLSEDPTWDSFDVELFLKFADPASLVISRPRTSSPLRQPSAREALFEGWRAVFGQCPYEAWVDQAKRWIRTAFYEEQHREHLLDPLIYGGGHRADVQARLHVIARDLVTGPAAPIDAQRHALFTDRVLQKINAALGIQVT